MTPKALKASERIYQLRTSKGMTQNQLAEKIGVTQSRVSEWESGTVEPSVETWMKLGALAAKDNPAEAALFWKETGIDSELLFSLAAALMAEGEGNMGAILTIAEEILKERVGDQGALEEQGKVALVPPFTEGVWKTQESMPALPLPGNDIQHKASTYYLIAGEPPQSSQGYSSGDRIVFDAADASARAFAPFLEKPVLINFSRPGRSPALPSPRHQVTDGIYSDRPLPWPSGLVIGRVRISEMDAGGRGWILLEPLDRPERSHVGIYSAIPLAGFEAPDASMEMNKRLHELLDAGIMGQPYYKEAQRLRARLASEVTALEGCEIMGRVVAVLHSSGW